MEDGINILEYWNILLKWKRKIFSIVIVTTVSAICISLLLPKIYKAEATIMPMGGQKNGNIMGAAAMQLGLGGLLGGASGNNASAQLLAVLKSRTLAERVIEKFDLIKVFYPKQPPPPMEDVVTRLLSSISFMDDKKTTLIILSAQAKNSQLAADLVNGYLNELTAYINQNAFTAAKRNRIFIEGQLERNKAELLESGKELSDFYVYNKISNTVPTVDVDVSVKTIDPILSVTEEHLKDLQKKANEVQEKIQKIKVVKDVPQQVYLQYVTLKRELLGTVNSLLTQQYEMAKIDEAKEDLNFQVIDWARVPARKISPKRAKIVISSFFISLFLSIFYALSKDYFGKMKKSPDKP